ncbi:MAG: DUF503 domain-containing protein [Myxococcota bacterium]
MLIAAALLEFRLHEAGSIKDKRRVVRALKDRIAQRYNVSIAEVAEQDDRHAICLGCVSVGIDPRHLRARMEKLVQYADSLGLAECMGDDVTVLRLDEIEEAEEIEEGPPGRGPQAEPSS